MKIIIKTSAGKCIAYYTKQLIKIDETKFEERGKDKLEDVQKIKVPIPFKNRTYTILKSSYKKVL